MTQEIPDCLKSNNSAQAIRAPNRHFQLTAASSAQQSSGGVALFNIPPSAVAISRGTMYLRARVSANITASSLGAAGSAAVYDATHALGFQGAGVPGAATNYLPTTGNASSVITRWTLYGTGSAVLDQINYANDVYNLFLIHKSNPSYLATDGQVQLGITRKWDLATSSNAYIDVCIPVPLSAFNNNSADFPLYLCRNPLTLQCDIASVARAIYATAAVGVTDFTISNMYLCYEVIEVPHSLVEAERHAIQSHPFVMPLTNYLNVQTAASTLSSYTLGLNTSSLRAVFVLPTDAASYSSASAMSYARITSDTRQNWGSGQNFQIFLDGNIKNSNINSDPVMQYTQLKQALNNNVQSNVLYPSLSTFDDYLVETFALGVDCLSFSEEGSLFGGSPCTNLNIQWTGVASGSNNNICTVICLYDSIMAISGDGLMEVKR
jgi:hypothetical protein